MEKSKKTNTVGEDWRSLMEEFKDSDNPVARIIARGIGQKQTLSIADLGPGAGKSYAIGQIAASFALKAKSGLIVVIAPLNLHLDEDGVGGKYQQWLTTLSPSMRVTLEAERKVMRIKGIEDSWTEWLLVDITDSKSAIDFCANAASNLLPSKDEEKRKKEKQWVVKQFDELRNSAQRLKDFDNPEEKDFLNLLRYDYSIKKKAINDLIKKYIIEPIKLRIENFSPEDENSIRILAEAVMKEHPYLEKPFPEIALWTKRVVLMTSAKLHQLNVRNVLTGASGFWRFFPADTAFVFDESDACMEQGLAQLEKQLIQNSCDDLYHVISEIEIHVEDLAGAFAHNKDYPIRKIIESCASAISQGIDKHRKEVNCQIRLNILGVEEGVSGIMTETETVRLGDKNLYVVHDPESRNDFLSEERPQLSEGQKADSLGHTLIQRKKTIRYLAGILSKSAEKLTKEINNFRRAQTTTGVIRHVTKREMFDTLCYELRISKYEQYLWNLSCSWESTQRPNDAVLCEAESVYSKGLRYYAILNREGKQRSAPAMAQDMFVFPETLLLELLSKGASIVLSSASACTWDPNHNYNIDYLNVECSRLGFGWNEISSKELAEVRYHCANREPETELNADIYIDLHKAEAKQILKNLLGSLETQRVIKATGDSPHYLPKLTNFLLFCQKFGQSSGTRAALCFGSFFWSKKISTVVDDYTRNNFSEIDLERWINIAAHGNVKVLFADSSNYVAKLKEAEKIHAESDYKIMLLTTYSTAGSGSSPKLPFKGTERNNYVFAKAENSDTPENVNWDSLYLDMPTCYLPVNAEDEAFCYQCSRIAVLLREERQLTSEERNRIVRGAFKALWNPELASKLRNGWAQTVYGTECYLEWARKLAIQAVGRITRSTVSRKKVMIGMHAGLANAFCKRKPEPKQTKLCSQAYHKLHKLLDDKNIHPLMDSPQRMAAKRIKKVNDSAYAYLGRLAKIKCEPTSGLTPTETVYEFRKELDLLREQAFVHPTLSSHEYDALPENLKALYVSTVDLRAADIDIVHPLARCHAMAFAATKLIRQAYEDLHMPLESAIGDYVLCPAATQQLLSGFVAEIALKALLVPLVGTDSKVTEELYEVGDLLFKNVMIDCKSYHSRYAADKFSMKQLVKKTRLWGQEYAVVILPWDRSGRYDQRKTLKLESGETVEEFCGIIDETTGEINWELLNQLADFIKKSNGEGKSNDFITD